MMKVSFAEVDEAYIRSKVDNGYYSSVTEVIRDAVRRLRESEERLPPAFVREMRRRAEEVQAGKARLTDGETFFDELAAKDDS